MVGAQGKSTNLCQTYGECPAALFFWFWTFVIKKSADKSGETGRGGAVKQRGIMKHDLKFWEGAAYSIGAGVVLWIVVWWMFNC